MKIYFRLKLVSQSLQHTKQMVFKISLLMSTLNCVFKGGGESWNLTSLICILALM